MTDQEQTGGAEREMTRDELVAEISFLRKELDMFAPIALAAQNLSSSRELIGESEYKAPKNLWIALDATLKVVNQ